MTENRRIYLDEDVQLMLRVAKGDEDAFNILYGKFFHIVADYATSRNGHCNSSEDITNEVFERVWLQSEVLKEWRTLGLPIMPPVPASFRTFPHPQPCLHCPMFYACVYDYRTSQYN